jgi:hypothetical protein
MSNPQQTIVSANVFVLSKLVIPSILNISNVQLPEIGSIVYSVNDKNIFVCTGTSWLPLNVVLPSQQTIQGSNQIPFSPTKTNNATNVAKAIEVAETKYTPIDSLSGNGFLVKSPGGVQQKMMVAGKGISIQEGISSLTISSIDETPKAIHPVVASHISFSPSLGFTATNVQAAILQAITIPTTAVMNSLLWFDGNKFQATQPNTENVSVASRGMINQLVVGNIPDPNDTTNYTLFVRKQNQNSVQFSFSGSVLPNTKSNFMVIQNENDVPATSTLQIFTVRNKSGPTNLFSVNADGSYLNFAPTISNPSTNLVIDTITGRLGILPSVKNIKKNIKPAKISMNNIPQIFTYQYEGSSDDSPLRLGPIVGDMHKDPILKMLTTKDDIDHNNLLSYCLGCLNEANQRIQALEEKGGGDAEKRISEVEKKFGNLLSATQSLHATVTTMANKS